MLRGAPTERMLMDHAAQASFRTSARLALQRFGSDVLDTCDHASRTIYALWPSIALHLAGSVRKTAVTPA